MKHPSEADLLGFMLGALDAQEQRRVQEAVDQNPRLEEDLLALKAALAPLETIDRPAGPPPGLARRTCQVIAMATRSHTLGNLGVVDREQIDRGQAPFEQLQCQPVVGVAASGQLLASSPALHVNGEGLAVEERPQLNRKSLNRKSLNRKSWFSDVGRAKAGTWAKSRFSFADFVVAITAATCIGALVFPLLLMSRFEQRRMGCQANMSSIYRSLVSYAENHQGNFVPIPTAGKMATAGSFAPVLKEAGLVPDDQIFACTGIAAAEGEPVHIPSCSQVIATDCPKQLSHYHRSMCGHYGYSLGYMSGEAYVGPRDQGRPYAVLLADAPSCSNPDRASKNHAGRGQNCLMETGQIRFLPEPVIGEDLIYTNDLNVVGPGLNDNDSVIAPSHVPLVIKVFPN